MVKDVRFPIAGSNRVFFNCYEYDSAVIFLPFPKHAPRISSRVRDFLIDSLILRHIDQLLVLLVAMESMICSRTQQAFFPCILPDGSIRLGCIGHNGPCAHSGTFGEDGFNGKRFLCCGLLWKKKLVLPSSSHKYHFVFGLQSIVFAGNRTSCGKFYEEGKNREKAFLKGMKLAEIPFLTAKGPRVSQRAHGV